MKRFQRVSGLWDWLPTFRAAAEHGSLSAAAKSLDISTSAVSRTVGLLEDAIGKPLFTRSGRRVKLNPAGEALLTATRDSMRLIDEALDLLTQQRYVGPLKIAVSDCLLSPFVLRAIAALTAEHPGLLPELSRASIVEFDDLLRRGVVDVAFGPMLGKPRELMVTPIGSTSLRVCAPTDHLATRRAVTTSDAFVVQQLDIEGWPITQSRVSRLCVDGFDAALATLEAAGTLAVLPEAFIRDRIAAGQLAFAKSSFRRQLSVYAVSRTELPWTRPVDDLIRLAKAHFGQSG